MADWVGRKLSDELLAGTNVIYGVSDELIALVPPLFLVGGEEWWAVDGVG